ncbi:hypothetical protein KCV87_06980 [Actinosynnema pretiosum subsp. pretiosum]|uniref:Uncharacterized protein n=1 Tax=Actinosynnema pretiosum subsp. pretiosum TaxID=103721 RepID=A0AA45L8X7_9PSEU|nr:hypothetical protein KCV87_06980 [Actinosynnema pretiosum subsp. pretiosum]
MTAEQQEQAFEKLRKCQDRREQWRLMEKLRGSDKERLKRELSTLRDSQETPEELAFTSALFLCEKFGETPITLIALAHDRPLPLGDALKAVEKNRKHELVPEVCAEQVLRHEPGTSTAVLDTIEAIGRARKGEGVTGYHVGLLDRPAWSYPIRKLAFEKVSKTLSDGLRRHYYRVLFHDRHAPAGDRSAYAENLQKISESAGRGLFYKLAADAGVDARTKFDSAKAAHDKQVRLELCRRAAEETSDKSLRVKALRSAWDADEDGGAWFAARLLAGLSEKERRSLLSELGSRHRERVSTLLAAFAEKVR